MFSRTLFEGLASSSTATFRTELRQYWFYRYTRSGGPLDSSGFEHTFIGETKGTVTGGHNWVNFYYEEKYGNFVYGPYQRTCQVINYARYKIKTRHFKRHASTQCCAVARLTQPRQTFARGTTDAINMQSMICSLLVTLVPLLTLNIKYVRQNAHRNLRQTRLRVQVVYSAEYVKSIIIYRPTISSFI